MHRLLLFGATSVAALVLSGPAAAWTWPADGDVLRPFALGSDAYAAGQHRGVDVAGPAGSSIRAPASGTVSFAGSLPTYGRSLTIATADGYAVTLVHLGTVEVAKGDAVEEGSPVATMGSSGEPEHAVPSVHMGVRVASQAEGYVDPLGLLPPRTTAPRPEAPPPPSPVTATPQVPSAAAASPGAPSAPAPVAAPAPAPAPASVAVGAPSSPSPPVAAAQAAGGSQTGSSSPAPSPSPSPAPVVSPTPEPVTSVSGPASSWADTSRPTAAQISPTLTVERPGELVVSASAHRVRPAVLGQSVSQATAAAAHSVAPVTGASTVPDAASDHGVRLRRLVTPAGTRVERAASESVTALETARLHPQVEAVPRDRSGRTASVEMAVTGGRRPPERAATVEHLDRAIRADALLPATTRDRAGTTSGPQTGGPSRAVLAALTLLVLLAVGIVIRAARRIAGDGSLLRHHADLLRELHAAHRARVHDRGSGRLRAPSTATRS